MEATSIITQLGAGSGIDMAALATNLADAQFSTRSQMLADRGERLERQISAASEIKNMITLLANAMGDRIRTGDLAVDPQVANSSVAMATSPLGTSGKGSYSLEVQALATSQTLASTAFASASDPVGAGQLVLRFGATSGAGFTEDAERSPVTIDIASGSSLQDIAAAISSSGSGVSAYVAQTADGPHLVMKGVEGEANGFIVEAVETFGEEGLAALAWNPSAGSDPGLLKSSANDAQFILDGLQMTSASNKTGQLAPGLSLELTGTNAGNPTTVSFSDPSDNITTAMNDLVSALNEITTSLSAATDPLSGELGRDGGVRALQRSLSGLAGQTVMPNAPAGSVSTLADLGLATERDGSFRLDAKRLEQTLERDPEGAAAMFTTGLYGVYSTLDKVARSASASRNPGSLAGSIARYERLSNQVDEQTADLADKQAALRARLFSRLTKSDARVAASQSTLAFLNAQIDAWNGANK